MSWQWFPGPPIDDALWLRTGIVGWIDKHGEIRFTDATNRCVHWNRLPRAWRAHPESTERFLDDGDIP